MQGILDLFQVGLGLTTKNEIQFNTESNAKTKWPAFRVEFPSMVARQEIGNNVVEGNKTSHS